MKEKTIGFIGGGRVARIILGGFKKAGRMAAEEVIDLIPVKPLGEEKMTIRAMYSSKLRPLYEKLKS
jgi:pyrroline-5-carboxylate reductase